MQGDIAREEVVKFFCEKIAEKIKKYPEAATALKELGTEVFKILPRIPDWAWDFYYPLFHKGVVSLHYRGPSGA